MKDALSFVAERSFPRLSLLVLLRLQADTVRECYKWVEKLQESKTEFGSATPP